MFALLEFDSIAIGINSVRSKMELSIEGLENLYGSISQRAFNGALKIVEKIELQATINVEPKITGEVQVIDKINKELEKIHQELPDSGGDEEIDNQIRQLDVELKLRGEIPYFAEYVKYRLIRTWFQQAFTFEQLWEEVIRFPFEELPAYDDFRDNVFSWMKGREPFLKQFFNEDNLQMELHVNETA